MSEGNACPRCTASAARGVSALYDGVMASSEQRRRWLVTGGAGFLGANLGAFLDTHVEAIAVTRTGSVPRVFPSAVAGDLARPEELAATIKDLRPQVVVHSAAMASHQACERDPESAELINAKATGFLAKASEEVGARFVYISTDAVFDGQRGHYSEDDLPNPISIYGLTKLRGEREAARATDALILRTNFFGWSPSGTRSILEFFVNELSAGHAVRGFTDFTTSSAYAQVLTQVVSELVAGRAAGIFHVTSPDALTKYEFGVAVAEEFDLDPALISPTRADIDPPRFGDISLNVAKVQTTLGRLLPTLIEGISRAREDAPTLRDTLRTRPTP